MPGFNDLRKRFGQEVRAATDQGMKNPGERDTIQQINEDYGLNPQQANQNQEFIKQGFVPGQAPSGAYREMLIQKIKEAQQRSLQQAQEEEARMRLQEQQDQIGYKKY